MFSTLTKEEGKDGVFESNSLALTSNQTVGEAVICWVAEGQFVICQSQMKERAWKTPSLIHALLALTTNMFTHACSVDESYE